MSEIKIGICGYGSNRPPAGWKERYESKLQAFSAAYRLGEINRSFYKLPMVRTGRQPHLAEVSLPAD